MSFTSFIISQASILYHESFLRYHVEVNQLELELKEQALKKDTYKLLSEQQDEVIKDIQAKLDREHTNLVEKVKVFDVKNENLVMVANNTTS